MSRTYLWNLHEGEKFIETSYFGEVIVLTVKTEPKSDDGIGYECIASGPAGNDVTMFQSRRYADRYGPWLSTVSKASA